MAARDGKFVWYELMTSDPDAAQSFYTDVVGWGTAPFEGSPNDYTMWTAGEKPIGGVMELPEPAREAGAPPHWIAYVATSDVDATVEKAKSLGGKVLHGPDEIPDVGRFAVLADPQGAAFAVYRSATEMPEDEGGGHPSVGEFSWNELATTDHEAAFEFYSNLFGWKQTDAMDMGEGGTYQMYGLTDQSMGGMFNKTPEMPGPPAWLYYATVADADEAAEKCRTNGGQVLNGPMDVPGGGRIVQGMDPQGAVFAVYAPPAE